MTTPAVRLWYALLVSFLASVVIAGTCLIYTAQMQQRSDRRWCALLSNLDETYKESPPRTEAGQRQAAEIRRLRKAFGCMEKGRR